MEKSKGADIRQVSLNNAEHYTWGKNCDGWHLVKVDELSVIMEKMPPGTSEVKHFHNKARQFFYIISGEASFEIGEENFILKENEGIEVPPEIPHRISNRSNKEIQFIVVSQPKSHGDRVVLTE